ncbi:MAG TPA: cytochrome D1 domain-containing protein [Gemmatimonadales bacterium]|nr:cytochrome D1 domain-containing protein [Gemmatimonadales bacterium]
MLLPLAALLQAAPAAPTGLLVVANKEAATASLIDVADGRALAILPTGTGPHEVAASRDGRWAVVTDYGAQAPGSSLTVIDLERRAVARTVDLGVHRRPHGVAFLPGDSLVAVTVEADRAVLVVHVGRGEVLGRVPTDQRGSHMISVTADGRRGYTANIMDGSITEVDLVARTAPRRLAVATMTEGVAVTPDGGQVWVGSNDEHTVTVVDARSWRAVDTIPGTSTPYRVTITPDGRVAVVSYPRENAVRLFDTRTRAELATVPIPGPRAGEAAPLGSTVSADSRWAYVALAAQDAVAVVDLRAHAVVKYLETGPGPDGIAIVAAR